ncbi:MAG: hypothetical protein QXN86_04370, partial [Candidatus Methanomethylicaceae archaeon]
VGLLARRRGRKSLKKLIDDAMNAADNRITTISPNLREELQDCFRYEDEIIVYSQNLVDLPGKVYKGMRLGLRRRGLKITAQKAVELRNDRLVTVNRYLVEGEGIGEEAEIYARLNSLKVVKVS